MSSEFSAFVKKKNVLISLHSICRYDDNKKKEKAHELDALALQVSLYEHSQEGYAKCDSMLQEVLDQLKDGHNDKIMLKVPTEVM